MSWLVTNAGPQLPHEKSQLVGTERHIADARKKVSDQILRIAELEAAGQSVEDAKKLLAELKLALNAMVRQRERTIATLMEKRRRT